MSSSMQFPQYAFLVQDGWEESISDVTDPSGDTRETVGGQCLRGIYHMSALYDDDAAKHMSATWHLFGDPSLRLKTGVPTRIQVDNPPSTIDIGQDLLQISVPWSDGEGAMCALSHLDQGTGERTLVARATVSAGLAQLQCLQGQTFDQYAYEQLQLTISKAGKVTYVRNIGVGIEGDGGGSGGGGESQGGGALNCEDPIVLQNGVPQFVPWRTGTGFENNVICYDGPGCEFFGCDPVHNAQRNETEVVHLVTIPEAANFEVHPVGWTVML